MKNSFYRKNLLLTLVSAVVICFAAAFTFLSYAGSTFDIKVKTISGDPGALGDIKISGMVMDYTMALDFSLDRKASHQRLITGAREVNAQYLLNQEHTWDRLNQDYTQYEMSFMNADGSSLRITRRLSDSRGRFLSYDSIEVMTGYRPKYKAPEELYTAASGKGSSGSGNASSEVNSTRQLTINTNSFVTTMQVLEGKLYFIIPKVQEYTGSSGLYVIEKFDRLNPGSGIRRIADISLEGTEDEIIALGKAGDMLYLIRQEPGKLSIHPFNTVKQAFEAEYTDDINLPENSGAKGQLYAVIGDDSCINIVMNGAEGLDIYTYSLISNIRRVSTVRNYKETRANGRMSLLYADEKLFIAQKVIEWPDTADELPGIGRNPDEAVFISVYDSEGELLFRGELDAGQKEDNYRQLKYNERLAANNQSNIAYRRFGLITLSRHE